MRVESKVVMLGLVSLGIALALIIRGRATERATTGAMGEGSDPASVSWFYAHSGGTGGMEPSGSKILARIATALRTVPAQHDFYQSYEAPMPRSEIEKVTARSSAEERPYKTEEGRKKALERLEKNIGYFKEALAEGEMRLAQAIQEGGRSDSEINEGRAALEELRNGIGFCEVQMRRIIEDDFD